MMIQQGLAVLFAMAVTHNFLSGNVLGAMSDGVGGEAQMGADDFTKTHSTSRTEAVKKALRRVADVEQQLQENKGCDKVDLLNITFDDRRWKKEALLTVQVANLMTSLWRAPGENGYPVAADDALLYEFVRSIVLFSPPVFGSVICFDNNLYKNYTRFCPYAFRDAELNGSVHVFDIANGDYDYTTDRNAIWWHKPKTKALDFKPAKSAGYFEERFNATVKNAREKRVVPHVSFENGTWTRPYFDCFGGKVWMVTYLAPFYNESDDFLGVVSIDVVLSDIDINQCDDDQKSSYSDDQENLMEFMGTHLCKPSTKCEAIPHQGFKRGSYVCTCKRGFFFPVVHASQKAFNGSDIEREHDRMLRGEPNEYEDSFECRRCSEGCDECVDDSPCIYSLKIVIRLTLCAVNGFTMVMTIVFAVYVALNWNNKIFKASSPRFMEIISLGAMLMYLTLIISYFQPTKLSCIARPWLRHIGFALVYGPLALKTWRVALIFRVRSAQKLALSDGVLLRRLFFLVSLYCSYLTAWTILHPPTVETARTSDDLKYERCVENWFDLTITFGDIVVLIWGMWLCFKIRNAPPAYNESKLISWAIYNAMFVTSFLMVVRVTTKGTSNPDIMYGLDFVLIHMDCSTVLGLMSVHKFLLVRQMQRTADIPSHNNMMVAEEEITIDKTVNGQEELLEKENSELKAEVRRLGEKLAALRSRLMTEENHHIQKTTAGGCSLRRKSAFTLPRKVLNGADNMKRHSLQLTPTPQDTPEETRKDTRKIEGLKDCKGTSNLAPEFYEIDHDASYSQELSPATSSLYSVSLHSKNYLHNGES